ncbi:MAG: hypothetical protein WD001_00240, partial [Woeseia sp.]
RNVYLTPDRVKLEYFHQHGFSWINRTCSPDGGLQPNRVVDRRQCLSIRSDFGCRCRHRDGRQSGEILERADGQCHWAFHIVRRPFAQGQVALAIEPLDFARHSETQING